MVFDFSKKYSDSIDWTIALSAIGQATITPLISLWQTLGSVILTEPWLDIRYLRHLRNQRNKLHKAIKNYANISEHLKKK